ncbi:MAG TPA: hypothetical protein P5123_07310 [Spirochaetota bacterium]|nr:hypothetical protein [Spirochaetota bacterium]
MLFVKNYSLPHGFAYSNNDSREAAKARRKDEGAREGAKARRKDKEGSREGDRARRKDEEVLR